MYKFIIYLENVKAMTDNCDDFIKIIDPKYIEARNQFQDIYLEFFINMMLMNTSTVRLYIDERYTMVLVYLSLFSQESCNINASGHFADCFMMLLMGFP